MIRNIQVLRAVAALLVVFYHLQAMLRDYAGSGPRTTFGASGVDIFFVISGFIMFHTTAGLTRTPWEFLRDRIVRIVPLYWMGTLLIVALYLLGRNPDGVQRLDGGDVLSALLFVPDVRADGVHSPVLTLGWTLIYEMFFYATFASLFFLRSHRRILVVLGVTFGAFLTLGMSGLPLPYAIDWLANPIILEFLIGAALALHFRGQPARGPGPASRPWLWAAIVAAVAAIVATEAMDPAFMKHGNPLRVVFYGLPAAVIVWAALQLERSGSVWHGRLGQHMGAASYALYLFHPVVMQTTAIVLAKAATLVAPAAWASAKASGLAPWLMAPVCLVAAVLAGSIVYRWIESPVTGWLKRRLVGPVTPRGGALRTAVRRGHRPR